MAASAAGIALVESMINHVVLPPRLPSRAESSLERIDISLIDRLIQAVGQVIAQQQEPEFLNAWEAVRRSLQACKHIHAGSKVNKVPLLSALQGLQPNDLIILYVFAQNAAVTIRRMKQNEEDSVIFEAFEASALSKDVLSAESALQWDFPGRAVSMTFSDFDDPAFQNELVTFLDKASTESIKDFAPRAFKSNTTTFESRDTVDPTMITQILMTLLEASGKCIFPTLLRKRIRDDVCWSDGAIKPWRRSPFWLVLRVSIQRYMSLIFDGEIGRCQFKFLMCILLANLLRDAQSVIPEENIDFLHFVKTKLCRRVAKLKLDMEGSPGNIRSVYARLFESFEPVLEASEKNASIYIDSVWAKIMKSSTLGCRDVLDLPFQADDRHLKLSLPNSGRYLKRVLDGARHRQPMGSFGAMSTTFDVSIVHNKPSSRFVRQFFSTSKIEEEVFTQVSILEDNARACIRLSTTIQDYMKSIGNTYNSNPEQKSMMLLNLMDLWVAMDRSAVATFPLLRDYNPWFTSDLLDVLQLWRLHDMDRLQKIRAYISERGAYVQKRMKDSRASRLNIFSDPETGCFAERFYNESCDTLKLQALRHEIEEEAEEARQQKEEEWEKKSKQYEELSQQISASTCLFEPGEYGDVHSQRCTKCWLGRKAKRIRIDGLEYSLPSSEIQIKAVIFELACPPAFAKYRESTWAISKLALRNLLADAEHKWLLYDYSQLSSYTRAMSRGFSLGSKKKSWLTTHYSKDIRFPVDFRDIYHSNGMTFVYLDLTGATPNRPMSQPEKPSLAHHCDLQIPKTSPLWPLRLSAQFAADAQGFSSYQIIASQSLCPSTLNVHEYMAFQALASGKARRWPQLLVELGSNNLNFSTEATAILVRRLALQVGPYTPESALGVVHQIFQDVSFCMSLLRQIDQRLNGMFSNWRETVSMETLITLALRTSSLGADVRSEALGVIHKIRGITHQWITLLRMEFVNATDAEAVRRSSYYALWAAVLCRRTFEIYCDSEGTITANDVQCFLEATMTIQDNLTKDPFTMDSFLRNALIRDFKMVYLIRHALRLSVEANPGSVVSALISAWPMIGGGNPSRAFTRVEFLQGDHRWWIIVELPPTMYGDYVVIHVHLLEGHLLLMGQSIGRLPPEWKAAGILEELFPGQNLLTYPSQMPGMTYMLAINMFGHQVHLGFRDGELILKTFFQNTVLEFVPRSKFGSLQSMDLPGALVDQCTHWLDLKSELLEVRPSPHIWKHRENNWFLNVRSGRVYRRKAALVDPHSVLFSRVSNMFANFETPRNLLVYQPGKGNMTVELRRLELSFFVNNRHLLESRQLRAEFDRNQDAGTWYGLVSKIVLKSVIPNTPFSIPQHQRSIIVPMGTVNWKKIGPHIGVHVRNDGTYGRFAINDILRRLECAVEPRIIYLKAMYHAYTSSFCSDPLTQRTGTEEAIHCLSSGYSQPWFPLTVPQNLALPLIAALTPRRGYYPKNLKVMQTISWDSNLPTTIQDGRFREIVESIQEKSKELSLFASKKIELPDLEATGDPHLTRRGQFRFYGLQEQRNTKGQRSSADFVYDSRDKAILPKSRRRIMDILSLIRAWPSALYSTPDLVEIFHQLPQPSTIGGFSTTFEKVLLTDLLDLDFVSEWGSLVRLCQSFEKKDKYAVMFLFAVVTFSHGSDLDYAFIKVLLAFATLKELKKPISLQWPSYTGFQREEMPSLQSLSNIMKPFFEKYNRDQRDVVTEDTEFVLSSKLYRQLQALQKTHEQKQEQNAVALAQHLLNQWPCAEPIFDNFSPISTPLLIDLANAIIPMRQEWLRLFKNWELFRYLSDSQQILAKFTATAPATFAHIETSDAPEPEVFSSTSRGCEFVGVSTLLRHFAVHKEISSARFQGGAKKASSATNHKALQSRPKGLSVEARQLSGIVDQLTSNSSSAVRQQYGKDLRESIQALGTFIDPAAMLPKRMLNPMQLHAEMAQAEEEISKHLAKITHTLEASTTGARWRQRGNLWPDISPVTILENLRSNRIKELNEAMQLDLINYAISITTLQRLRRIEDSFQKRNTQKQNEETQNLGHTNWQPIERTDWLLLEIDSNLLLRPTQVDVAIATISPSSGSNSVLQMNMGQGKTSCIMPMAASFLADGKSLMRVIVPKSLLLQTAQLLHARLGGLIGREIRHVPFSRKTATDTTTTRQYWLLHNNIRKDSGVMLALPEHILSFKLSGLQQLSDGRISEAKTMIDVQSWITRSSRDVIDEADSILAIRTQLIYPSGAQKTVDGHPHRWTVTEMILHHVEGHLWNLEKAFPYSIEVHRRSYGSFPVVSFLRKDAEDALLCSLVDDIYRGRTSILPQDTTRMSRDLIKKFISDPQVSSEDEKLIGDLFPDRPAAKQAIYLLRGLIVHRILLMAMKKRWNVQYGLHPTRDPIAVPYMAKGTPSEQAEWGHPDVAILFTCLSFYYQGLTIDHFRQTLEHVLKSDDPAQVYDRFAINSNLPGSLQDWSSINVEDEAQVKEIWMHARSNMIVVDYFLNNFVFPRHAKQFHMKLQASGWDLPLFSILAPKLASKNVTQSLSTGFSGTNDWKRMLPLTISQRDLPGLAHTNAEVLTYLLQPRNRKCVLAANPRGGHLSERGLLECIHHENIRVLIDAGASILEMTNFDLVKAWLEIDTDAQAAVYFNDDNKAMVWYRRGYTLPLLASTFADDLSDCLVYLDEAHTRGTDLKIPPQACGALTLGLGQTKDHTVQAAMRLRQLGTTQSVRFFVPPGVYQNIIDLQNKPPGSPIDSSNVISWLLQETCNGIEQLQPLYFSQGADFCRRHQAVIDNPEFLTDEDQRDSLLKSLREIELQTLEKMYGVSKAKSAKTTVFSSTELKNFMRQLNTSRKCFQDTGSAVHGSALQEVEQEREVAHEVETVREVQKIVRYNPFGWPGLHRDLEHFVRTGRVMADSAGYEPAFGAMARTSLGRKYRINRNVTSGRLFVSKQFTRTVNLPHGKVYDNLQRNFNWVLWSGVTSTAMIVIPEEAEQIFSIVNRRNPIYLIAYSAPVTRKMLQFGNLNYFAVPSLPSDWVAPTWLKIELGLYSGRLYFEYEEYAPLLELLGIQNNISLLDEELEDLSIETDGACESEDAGTNQEDLATPKFARKPLTFLQEWLALSRKGQDFSQTPMGYVSQGKPLIASHPFFLKDEKSSKEEIAAKHIVGESTIVEEDGAEDGFLDDEQHFEGAEELKDDFDDRELDNEERVCDEDASSEGVGDGSGDWSND